MSGVAFFALCGCGGASPPGSELADAQISGRVVDAATPGQGVSGIEVSFTPSSASTRAMSDVTDDEGYYELTELPASAGTLRVRAGSGGDYQTSEFEVDAGGGGPLSLRITVLPAELASVVASVQVLPSAVRVGTGGGATFQCVVTDTDDRRLSLEPTWLASSAIGSIDDSGQLTALGEPGSGEVVAVVGNLAGSAQVSVATLGGRPPEVLGLAADPDRTLGHGESVVLTASAQDPDGDSVSYDWISTAGSIEGSGASVTWTAPDVSGAFAVSCVVSDPDGQSDALVRTIRVGAGGVGVGIESTGGQAQ